MSETLEKTVEKIISTTEAAELERMAEFRLSDAIREGASVSDQAYTWCDGDKLCAMSAGIASARARKYL